MGMDMGKMLEQLTQMQQEMQQAQEELANESVTASAGGGAVKATMTGALELVSIEIDPEVVDPEDVEMLQDMVLAATNEALRSAQELAANRMNAAAGGGMVTVTANGAGEIRQVKIDPKAIDPDDPEMLEDMILAAVNEAVRSAHSLAESKLGGLAGGALGGLGLPGF